MEKLEEITKRPIALLETPLNSIDTIAVDQQADHIVARLQEQRVKFWVKDQNEAMIGAKRRQQYFHDRRHLERMWLNRQSCCAQSGAMCASQFVRGRTKAVIQEREPNGGMREQQYDVDVWQESTLSSETFHLTFWSRTTDLMDEINMDRRRASQRALRTSRQGRAENK